MTETLDTVKIVGATAGTLLHAAVPLLIALDPSYSDAEREYNLGRHRGQMVGVGVENIATLRAAESTPFAIKDVFAAVSNRYVAVHYLKTDEQRNEVAFASGVLYGYAEATDDRDDAADCFVCTKRVCKDLDDYSECMCGVFCTDADCNLNENHTEDCRYERAYDEAADWAVAYALDDFHGAS